VFKEKLGLAGPSLPLDRFYDERFRRLQKLRHDIHAPQPVDETNGHIAMQVQSVCHDTLPRLISFSLGLNFQ